MTRKLLAAVLIAVFVNLSVSYVSAAQQTREEKAATKIKKYVKTIKKWSKDDPLKVTMLDGTKIRGYVTEATDDHFVLEDRKTKQLTTIDYKQVKDVGVGVGNKTKIALGIAAGGLILAVVCATHCRE